MSRSAEAGRHELVRWARGGLGSEILRVGPTEGNPDGPTPQNPHPLTPPGARREDSDTLYIYIYISCLYVALWLIG